MFIRTHNYKSNRWGISSTVQTKYSICPDGVQHYGQKTLITIVNCPNRYWARKAATYVLKHYINMFGWSQHMFDNTSHADMPKSHIISFKDVSFALNYEYSAE